MDRWTQETWDQVGQLNDGEAALPQNSSAFIAYSRVGSWIQLISVATVILGYNLQAIHICRGEGRQTFSVLTVNICTQTRGRHCLTLRLTWAYLYQSHGSNCFVLDISSSSQQHILTQDFTHSGLPLPLHFFSMLSLKNT